MGGLPGGCEREQWLSLARAYFWEQALGRLELILNAAAGPSPFFLSITRVYRCIVG